MKIEAYLEDRGGRVDRELARLLSDPERRIEPRLLEAMRYSALSAGKRIRPLLTLAAGEAVGGEVEPLLPFACAIEMIHTYSLIHDDLPAMDDDPVRRGRPSNHVVFGDGIAILAGDGLLTEAFAVIGRYAPRAPLPPERILAAVSEIAAAAGPEGMVGGQTADLLAEGGRADLARLESIHRRKTGALLRAAVRTGAILGGADPPELEKHSAYGAAIGLAFQIADDLLDEEGRTEATGKGAKRDRERGKSTYPSILGVAEARRLLEKLLGDGVAALSGFDSRAEPLRQIARHVVSRAL